MRPSSGDTTGPSTPVAPNSNPTATPDAAAAAGRAADQTTGETPSARADPIVVHADAVNRPVVDTRPLGAEVMTPAPRPRGSHQGPSSALWLLVALVIGLAAGAVAGMVATLLVLG